MKTVVIQIGNSDDKLSQVEWHNFVADVTRIVEHHCFMEIHFAGGSSSTAPWQNYCIVGIALQDPQIDRAKSMLIDIREKYDQDSVAITTGDTEFI